jgi:Zn-dependent peptidase ImmA (M78 family)/transcriptional regulator with XRE-family HTH domain
MSKNFNPEMLILARESRGLTQSQLADRIPVQQGTISKIEAGALLASSDLLEKIASELDYPLHIFEQSDKVFGFNSTVFFHRKRAALPDRILRTLHAQVNLERIRVNRLLRGAEIASNGFRHIEPAEYENKVETVAQLVRATWQAPSGPIRNMTQCIEDAGGVVIRFDFGTRQADAISEWVAGHPPLFFVNAHPEITGDRIRLTLAHELGHVIMHKFPNPGMEEEANKFAAEFLMPEGEIKSSLRSLSIPKLADLKSYWGVSMAALVRRAFDLKTITESQYKYLLIKLGRAGYKMREPIETDIPIEKPTLLAELIQMHLRQLGYPVSKLSDFMLLHEHEFRPRYMDTGLRLVS